MRSRFARTIVAGVATIGLAAAVAPAADAAQVGSVKSVGTTRIVVNPAVTKLITSAGITPSTTGPAKASAYGKTLAIDFPITGVKLSTLRLAHKGGIKLAGGGRSIYIKRPAVNLTKGTVSAVVDGSIGKAGRVRVFDIVGSKSSKGLVRLNLTATSAKALNKTFKVHAFSAGAKFGWATPSFTLPSK